MDELHGTMEREGRARLEPREGPADAVTLFDGRGLDAWTGIHGGPAPWRVVDGALEVVPGAGDICTKMKFRSFHLHLEFWLPDMGDAFGQDRANSGIFFLGRYELQILDSFGAPPSDDSCGAIYKVLCPLRNACRAPETWQTLDVAFRAPPLNTNGFVTGSPHVTAFLNRTLIQNNAAIIHPTEDPSDRYEALPGALRLQDHGCAVRFRDIWIAPDEARSS